MTITTFAYIGSLIFTLLGLWHFYWAIGGSLAKGIVIPEVNNNPAFVPSVTATVAVGLALIFFAFLVAAKSGFVIVLVSGRALSWLCFALAFILLVRAIGDFHYIGFFKRVRGTRFAHLDTLVYSPFCLFLSLIVYFVASKEA
ncbi:MAG TPA: DUF3995 domain-containing protein [Methylotenera sp.]|nr:DUF3995 domain-containing protein [Methylotenera sp.]HPN01964.1 DUF3995 domain-containing protein [Methylotenera sp.]